MRTLNEIADSSWIGTFPKKWNMLPIKSLFNFSKGLNITKEDLTDNGSKVISYGQIHAKDNNKTGIHSGMVRYVPKEKTLDAKNAIVHKGGFIFADTSEDLDGVGNCAYNDSDKEIFGGYHTIVLNPIKDEDNKYFAYLFQTDAWRTQLRRQLVDVKVFSVNQGILSETYLIIPPKLEQKAIVSYLDFHCKNIDESIKRHQAIIEKLEKYKVSVIRQAVTKGLNSNVNLGKTNIAWVNSIPNHWSIDKVSRIFKTIGSGTTPDTKSNQFYGGDIPWIQSGDLSQWLLTNTDQKIKSLALESVSSLKMYKAPFIVIAMYGASIGNISISQIDACTNQACCVLKDSIGFDKYFAYCLYAAKDHLIFSADGGTQPNISQKKIKQIWLPIPPLDEQIRICEYLEKILLDVRTSIERYLEIISYLRTYQRSVIYQAVTGKIDLKENPL